MKANEVPEKIWINPSEDLQKLSGHIDKDSIEYTSTDAFIEKAADWLRNNIGYYVTFDTEMECSEIDLGIYKDFKKYMKGE